VGGIGGVVGGGSVLGGPGIPGPRVCQSTAFHGKLRAAHVQPLQGSLRAYDAHPALTQFW